MTDAAEAVNAAPKPNAVPEAQVTPPEPVHSDMAEVKEIGEQKRQEEAARAEADKIAKKEEQESKKPASIRDTMKAADEKLRKDAEAKAKEPEKAEAKPDKAEEKPEAKDEPKKEGPERGEDGKFKAKEPTEATAEAAQEAKAEEEAQKPKTGFHEAPKRFSDDAKAEWEKAPEPVKAEVHRAISEMEKGINQYREVVEPLKPYIQLAQQHGVRVEQAMDNYINLERTLLSDPERGLQMVADYAGINLREYASKLLNQTPEEIQGNQDNTIRELRTELAALKQQLGGVSQTIEQQRVSQTEAEVRKFADEHPRFDELADDIKFFLQSGRTQDLSEAYELAERLNPAPAPKVSPQPEAPAPAPVAHTHKGSKSISGAPSAGSSPARSEPSKSIRDALRRAQAKAG